jgi:hypothetical protein
MIHDDFMGYDKAEQHKERGFISCFSHKCTNIYTKLTFL